MLPFVTTVTALAPQLINTDKLGRIQIPCRSSESSFTRHRSPHKTIIKTDDDKDIKVQGIKLGAKRKLKFGQRRTARTC